MTAMAYPRALPPRRPTTESATRSRPIRVGLAADSMMNPV